MNRGADKDDIFLMTKVTTFLGEKNKSAQKITSGGVYLNQLLVDKGAAKIVSKSF